MLNTLKEHYQGKKVFLTGHTGFKGAWLTLWLKQMGAEVIGYSLPAATETNLFDLLALEKGITHIEGDIRDFEHLQHSLHAHQPDIIFHLAAQALVLDSYKKPKETFEVNASGTLNVLEGIRLNPKIKAGVMVTTDKCYENRSWLWGYRENDPLGGKDPYSASKSMAELCIEAYRHSFFSSGQGPLPQIAAVRAGNIIGGGDFAAYRILPDSIKALMQDQAIQVRHPRNARPWLYVLDALYGYLLVGANLMSTSGYAESWNFGPKENQGITVAELVEKCIDLWGAGTWLCQSSSAVQAEMPLLRLNWDKAAARLAWQPLYNWQEALAHTISWYKAYHEFTKRPASIDLREISLELIDNYLLGNKDEIHTSAYCGSLCY